MLTRPTALAFPPGLFIYKKTASLFLVDQAIDERPEEAVIDPPAKHSPLLAATLQSHQKNDLHQAPSAGYMRCC